MLNRQSNIMTSTSELDRKDDWMRKRDWVAFDEEKSYFCEVSEVDLPVFYGKKLKSFSPWKISSQDFFLPIFSPAVAIDERAFRHSSGLDANLLRPARQCLSAAWPKVRSNSASHHMI